MRSPLVVFLFGIALGVALHQFVERPMLKIGREALTNFRRTRAACAIATAVPPRQWMDRRSNRPETARQSSGHRPDDMRGALEERDQDFQGGDADAQREVGEKDRFHDPSLPRYG